MLERLGRFCARHHLLVIGAWLVLAVLLVVGAGRWGGSTQDSFTIPGTQSQAAVDLLQEEFPAANGPSATVVFEATEGSLTDSGPSAAVAQVLQDLGQLPGTPSASNPLTDQLLAHQVSSGSSIAYTTLQWAPGADLPSDIVDQMEEAAGPGVAQGLNTQFGGAVVDAYNAPSSALSDHADDIGIALAVVILLVSLGSAVAMLLPIGTALFGLGISTAILTILERYFEIGSIAPILGAMLGIGVGIDYSLFVVSRFRQELDDGHDAESAVGRAVGTAGSAVLFAAITVCLAMVALSVIGVPYVRTLGLAAAMFVLVTVAAALTFLPALLCLLGRRVNSWSLPWGRSSASRDVDFRSTASARWGTAMARRAWVFAPLSIVLLALLAFPVTRMELGFPSDSSAPTDTTQRQAYDLITEGFGPGANGPLLIVGPLPDSDKGDPQAAASTLQTFTQQLQQNPSVQSVTPGSNPPDYTILFFNVVPKTGPNDPATADMVEQLRSTGISAALQGTQIDPSQVFVGGVTAEEIDLTDRIEQRMPLLFLIVLGGSFLLLMLVFRSVLVPLKAAVLNLLSIGAAYGIVVAVFEWGWLEGAIGLQETVVIASFVPVMMFAILFGLSMDYEVFLMSRIREDYLETGDASDSVVVGIARTARVITSAALIMIAVFLAFVTNPQPTVKMLGLGMAMAVLIDATVVRMTLVPSIMEIAGKRAWWFPRWLDRILPRISVDGRSDEPEPEPSTAS